MRKTLLSCVAVVAVGLASCRSDSAGDTRSATGPEKRTERIRVVRAPSSGNTDRAGAEVSTLMRGDQVQVQVLTAAIPRAEHLIARWFAPGGALITEDRISLEQRRAGVVTSHAADTAAWKPGTYRVEVWLDDEKMDEASFEIGQRREDQRERAPSS